MSKARDRSRRASVATMSRDELEFESSLGTFGEEESEEPHTEKKAGRKQADFSASDDDGTDSGSEDEASFDNLLPTRNDSAKSHRSASAGSTRSSAGSSFDSSPGASSGSPHETPKLDDVGAGFDEGMDEWEQQMMQGKENQSPEVQALFGGYSSSDLSAEEFDDEELLSPKAVVDAGSDLAAGSDPAAGPGEDEIHALMAKAQESVEGLREIEQLADEQKWLTSSLASAAIAGRFPLFAVIFNRKCLFRAF